MLSAWAAPSGRLRSLLILIVLGGFVLAALATASADESAPAALEAPSHPVRARIQVQLHDDGRIEFCLTTEDGQPVCPSARFARADRLEPGRWALSSAAAWEIPVQADRIVRPVRGSTDAPAPGASCAPDYERMFAATWKLETTAAQGSAFHIGNGRFLTAYHVVEDAPPFVMLSHGKRAVAAAVRGTAPSLDSALLEVYDRSLVADLPAVELRAPTRADIGQPTWLVGYPGGGPLTATVGGVVERVWAENLQTSSDARGGNSGGPMFDRCGAVIGVLWASTAVESFTWSGRQLIEAVEQMSLSWPTLPDDVPGDLRLPPGWLIWHWGPSPPANVDCSSVSADFWVGWLGPRGDRSVQFTTGREPDLGGNDICVHGPPGVEGFSAPPGARRGWRPDLCVGAVSADAHDNRLGLTEDLLYQSSEPWGRFRIKSLAVSTECPRQMTHQIELAIEGHHDTWWTLKLFDARGRELSPGDHGYQLFTNVADGAWATVQVELSAAFRPARLEVEQSPYQNLTGYQALRYQARIGRLTPVRSGPSLPVEARVAVRLSEEDGRLEFCLDVSHDQRICPPANRLSLERARPNRWYRTDVIEWLAPLADSGVEAGRAPADIVGYGCALSDEIADVAWRVETLTGRGTAIYVGQGQFVTDNQLFRGANHWAVGARAETALPLLRVASDRRNGLALLEVIGGAGEAQIGAPIRFSQAPELAEGSARLLVAYPSVEARQFGAAIVTLREIGERTFSADPRSGFLADRVGAPVVDPCTHQLEGVSIGGSSFDAAILRADLVSQSIARMRDARLLPAVNTTAGPPAAGPFALLERPVWVGAEQPDLGGRLCNVRTSERYDLRYAVYLLRSADYARLAVLDGEPEYGSLSECGPSGRVVLFQYRSDAAPDVICLGPYQPRHPLTTVELKFVAPPGVELLQLTELVRAPCPGLAEDGQDGTLRWESDLYLQLRVSASIDLNDLAVQFRDADGDPIEQADADAWAPWAIDPDVVSWLINLIGEAEPARLVVTIEE